MIVKTSDGRPAKIEIEFGSDPDDCYATSGYYTDPEGPCDDLPISEMEWLNANMDFSDEWYQHMIGRAEAWAEGLER